MATIRRPVVLLAALITVAAGAQTVTNTYPGSFIDISTTGGTAITGVGDDTAHVITTTIGNAMFPAGTVTIGNNGDAAAGYSNTFMPYFNYDITPTGTPTSLPATATGIVLPWWDDLYPDPNLSSTTLWYQELSGVLYIMWLNDNHFADTTPGAGISFEVQVYQNPGAGPWIQYVYQDTVFGGTSALYDNAASASIGYCGGALAGGNAKWSFDTAGSVGMGTVLSFYPPFIVTPSSPNGAGSIQVDLNGGPAFGVYFLALTPTPTTDGWFFGINISFQEIGTELATGWPFAGALDGLGHYQIGPVGGIASGFTFYAVGLTAPPGSGIPSAFSQAFSYTIP